MIVFVPIHFLTVPRAVTHHSAPFAPFKPNNFILRRHRRAIPVVAKIVLIHQINVSLFAYDFLGIGVLRLGFKLNEFSNLALVFLYFSRCFGHPLCGHTEIL